MTRAWTRVADLPFALRSHALYAVRTTLRSAAGHQAISRNAGPWRSRPAHESLASRLVDERRIRGRWWLAGLPKKGATPGTFVISPRREVRLELDDDMKTNIDWWALGNDPEARTPLLRVFGEK